MSLTDASPLDQELRERTVTLLTWVVLVFSPVHFAWTGLDYLLLPEAWRTLLVYRVLTLVVTVSALMVARGKGPRVAFEATAVVLLAYGLSVVLMLPHTGLALGSYVTGLALAIVGIGALPVWPTRWSTVVVPVVTVASIAVVVHPAVASSITDCATNVFTLATAGAIGLFLGRSRYAQAVSEYLARLRESELAAELRVARDAALASSRAKAAFLANISHEIRTPMNAVLGYAGFLAESAVEGEEREWVDGIQDASHLLLNLINDVLDFSKLEEGKVTLEARAFDLRSVSRAALSLVSTRADEAGLELSMTVDPEVPTALLGDAVRLQQVLLNLVSNAVKFTERGFVRVHWAAEPALGGDARLRLEVRDSGIGMTGEQCDRLFVPFAQADASTTRRFGGTGLGLSISRLLVEAMGGTIGVESEPSVGACFWVSLALPTATPPADLVATSAALPPRIARDLRVLVAEDNLVNQRIVSRMLNRLGCRVDVANNGREALEALARDTFDLVLMDAQMPELDGIEATRCARAETFGQHVRIVALTANATDDYRRACLEAGMNDFISKPVTAERLAAAIDAAAIGAAARAVAS